MNLCSHRVSFSIALLFCLFSVASGQITFSPSVANFLTIDTDVPDSIVITITNNTTDHLTVTDIKNHHSEFTFSDTAFTLGTGDAINITVYVLAKHNLDFFDHAIFESNRPDVPYLTMFASAWYSNTYYDGTQNLWDEDLKAALKNTLDTSHSTLTYTTARDRMFMDIDNDKVNGQGAAQNTIECVYTGQQVVGYVSRTDAQNSGNFTTEHTFPQSKFGGGLPMVSDIHHLFPCNGSANTERSNKPFGIVSNPSWSNGGSKSNSSAFEPRDVQKGPAARALFYFVTRYSDTTSFVAPQEVVLRQWATQFPPVFRDSMRNELIYAEQGNRNPFVDHPEFLDRITSICTVDSGYLSPVVHFVDTLEFGNVQFNDTAFGQLYISNQGRKRDLNLSGFTFSDSTFFIIGNPPTTVESDKIATVDIGFLPPIDFTFYSETLTITTDDPAQSNVTIGLGGNTNHFSIDAPAALANLIVYPVPANSAISISGIEPGSRYEFEVLDLSGRVLKEGMISNSRPQVLLPRHGSVLRVLSEDGSRSWIIPRQ